MLSSLQEPDSHLREALKHSMLANCIDSAQPYPRALIVESIILYEMVSRDIGIYDNDEKKSILLQAEVLLMLADKQAIEFKYANIEAKVHLNLGKVYFAHGELAKQRGENPAAFYDRAEEEYSFVLAEYKDNEKRDSLLDRIIASAHTDLGWLLIVKDVDGALNHYVEALELVTYDSDRKNVFEQLQIACHTMIEMPDRLSGLGQCICSKTSQVDSSLNNEGATKNMSNCVKAYSPNREIK
jgi:tetratricopeptide (TPR) repeat protein